jgi:hypothetical protein
MSRFQTLMRLAFGIAALLAAAGCASQDEYDFINRRRPTMALVYDFHATATTVFEDQRLIAQGTANFPSASLDARQAAIGQIIRTRISQKLVDGINAMGLAAQAGDPSLPVPPGAVVIRGDFFTTSPGNIKTRYIATFGAEKTTVDTDVYVLGAVTSVDLRPLLHFFTNAEAGPMPALVAPDKKTKSVPRTMEAVTLNTYSAQVDQLVDQSTGQALANLSLYFANQGWISRDQIRAPNFAGP